MIPLLPKWYLHGNRPTFYDGDAVTMLELASTLHASMNSVIEEYNKLEESVNKSVSEFMAGEVKNREEFEVGLRQEFQDFIDIVNLKCLTMQTQIDEYKKYMVDNIQGITVRVVNDYISNGGVQVGLNYDETSENLSIVSVPVDSDNNILYTANEEKIEII